MGVHRRARAGHALHPLSGLHLWLCRRGVWRPFSRAEGRGEQGCCWLLVRLALWEAHRQLRLLSLDPIG